jgi:hypothetical protein
MEDDVWPGQASVRSQWLEAGVDLRGVDGEEFAEQVSGAGAEEEAHDEAGEPEKAAAVDEVEEVLKNPKKLATRIAKRLDGDLDEISKMVQELLGDYNKSDINFDENYAGEDVDLGKTIKKNNFKLSPF